MSTLHITNGDSAGDTLRTFVNGRVVVTADPLYEGPAPAVEGDAWRRLRAAHLSGDDAPPDDLVRRFLASQEESDRAIERAGAFDEVVLWFEHDLFDQLLLIRTLTMLAARGANVTLICIGEFPGIDRFVGLGQLTAPQLSTLAPHRQTVTTVQYEAAAEAWSAFRAPTPSALLARRATPVLPFLDAALRRFLEEYPSTIGGLSRSQHAALNALAGGPMNALTLFTRTQRLEDRPFMGDLSFFTILRALAHGREALVRLDAPDQPISSGAGTVALTEAGRDVLDGRADAIGLNGIDTWRGGVHLAGADRSPWRWDPAAETLVS